MTRKAQRRGFPLKLLFLVLIAVAIPVTLTLSKQQQDISQEAAVLDDTTTTTPATCNPSVKKITLENDCGPVRENKFRNISFTCRNGTTKEMGGTKDRSACLTAHDWIARASRFCKDNTVSCKSLTPTPTPCTRVTSDEVTYGPSCQGGYSSVSHYKCTDGHEGSLPGDETNCKSATDWNRKVVEACAQRGSCYQPPTATPTSCTPVRVGEGSGPRNRCQTESGKDAGYKNYLVKCTDGHEETLTDTNEKDGCPTAGEWQARAKNLCLRRSAC